MGRAPCCSKVGLHRGPWTAREDALLIKYIEAHGEGQWRSLPKKAGLLRCGKSCRLRWMNYLRPDIKRGNITSDEEDLIIRLHGLLGNRWSLIAGRLPGRTDNEIKNYWNTHLSKRLRSQGTDPNTHKKLSESELEKSANLSKKKGRSSTTSHANKGKSSRKTNHQLHKKGAFKNDSNGSEERERTKIHLPKPVRVTSIMPMTRCNSNGSFETNASTTTACSRQSDQPQNHGIMLDQENPMLDMSWPLHHDDHAIIMDDGDHGLDHLMMMDVFQPHHENHHHHDHDHDYDHHELAPSDDAVQLEKLYEEYLQLIKTDHDHDGDGYGDVDVDGHDDDDDEGAQLDSLTEYFLI